MAFERPEPVAVEVAWGVVGVVFGYEFGVQEAVGGGWGGETVAV